jgi:hypothetical protein
MDLKRLPVDRAFKLSAFGMLQRSPTASNIPQGIAGKPLAAIAVA